MAYNPNDMSFDEMDTYNGYQQQGLNPNAAWQQMIANFGGGGQAPGYQAVNGGQQPDAPVSRGQQFYSPGMASQSTNDPGISALPQTYAQSLGGFSMAPGQNVGPAGGGGGGNNALLQALMGQAQTGLNDRLKQYQNLIGSITGKHGLLNQLGATGNQRINQQEQNQVGQTEQDLISRGLGNSTIRSNMLGGVHKNAELERQSLNEGIAGQKIGANMSLFNANPAPSTETYLNLLSRLGSAGGR